MQNKSAFLCGVMKTYRQREKQGSKVQESIKGPDEAKIKVNKVMWLCCVGGQNESHINMLSSSVNVLFSVLFFLRLCWSGQDTPWMSPQGRENMEVPHLRKCSKEHSQGLELR